MKMPTYHPLGDQALLVQYENRIDKKINERVRFLAEAIDKSGFEWIKDLVFTFHSLLIQYDYQKARYPIVLEAIKTIESSLNPSQILSDIDYRTYEIMTVYGGPFGPDLDRVAKLTQKTSCEIIRDFSATVFTVFFLGFLGSQPYLGGLPEYLKVPRLDTPRNKVSAGSVGIGGLQAGIVTIDQPSGFNFIGWSPYSLYNPLSFPPSALRAGDRIIFKEITANAINDFIGKTPEPI